MTRPATRADIDLRIGDLIIEGFSPTDSRLIAAALELELGRLLADGPSPFGDGRPSGARQEITFDRVDAGEIRHAEGASPRALGRAAARAVVRELRQLSAGGDARPGPRAKP